MKENYPKLLQEKNVFVGDSSYYIHKATISKNFPLHQHEFFEIDVIVSGTAQSNINDKQYSIEPGTVLFLTPADFHDIILTSEEPLITYNLAFPSSLIYKRVWSTIPLSCKIAALEGDDYQGILSTCRLLLREYENPTSNIELIMKTGIEWIIFWIARNSPEYVSGPNDTRGISAILAYIYDNFTVSVTRDEAAKIMHVNPMHFSKYFHRITGMTFQDYVLDLKLKFALRLLKTTDITIAEAAASSGFNSSEYFSRAFKKKFKISPSEFKIKQQNP